ncbi:MAG: IS630 transposase-related protein, partial [Bacilli bacterium]
MASKGQKFNKYSDDLKQEIMSQIKQGMSIRYVAKQYNIPSGTIFTWTDKKNHPEKVTGLKRGRKNEKNLTKEDWKERYEILKKYQAFL